MTTIAATTDDRQTEPASRRDAWRAIASGVNDGLPEPKSVTLYLYDDGRPLGSLTFDDHAAAAAWAERLGIDGTLRPQTHKDGRRGAHYHSASLIGVEPFLGWDWAIAGYEPAEAVDGD